MGEKHIITIVNKKVKVENPNKGVWKRFFWLLWKVKLPIVWIIIYLVITMTSVKIGIMIPAYTAELFNGDVSVELVTKIVITSILTLFIGSIGGVVQGVATAKLDMNLRNLVWGKMLRLPVIYYDQNKPREMVSRITTDIEAISALVMKLLVGEIVTAYLAYETAKQLATYDVKLMFTMLIFIPIFIIIAFVFGRFQFKTNKGVQSEISKLTQILAEMVSSVPLIKAFTNEKREEERGNKAIDGLYKARISEGKVTVAQSPVFSLVGLAQTLLIVFTGMFFINKGEITLTMWTAYFLYVGNLVNILNSKAGDWIQIKAAQGASDRVSRILMEDEEAYNEYKVDGELEGKIIFKNVSFEYDGNKVLNDVSCIFEQGKVTALVGLSGCGKTTMLNLIDRFYRPSEGRITVGSRDIADYKLTRYRESIAYVSQDCGIFSGSIRNNLLYGIKRNVTEEEMIEAAKRANVYEFVMNFDHGFDTEVGELGGKLSGGQKQCIAIARAILKDPNYLLLDEATANMDVKATDDVLKGLRNLMEGRTVIMVTHDVMSMKMADEIIILENGKITGTGNHEELIEDHKFYRDITLLQ